MFYSPYFLIHTMFCLFNIIIMNFQLCHKPNKKQVMWRVFFIFSFHVMNWDIENETRVVILFAHQRVKLSSLAQHLHQQMGLVLVPCQHPSHHPHLMNYSFPGLDHQRMWTWRLRNQRNLLAAWKTNIATFPVSATHDLVYAKTAPRKHYKLPSCSWILWSITHITLTVQ